jgi:hypothetical protein
MKLAIASLLLLSAAPAFAGEFSLNLEGKTFTCTEGGGVSAGCACKRDPSNSNEIAAYVGDIKVYGNWYASESGIRGCKTWIKEHPDTCN